VIQQIRDVVTQSAGVLRDEAGLHTGLDLLRPHLDIDAGLVGYLVAWSALQRTESRGGHTRIDFPQTATHAHHTLVSEHDLAAVSVR